MLSLMSTKRHQLKMLRESREVQTRESSSKTLLPGTFKIQQWRKLLSSPANKTSLTKFLIEEWKGPRRQKLKDKVLYVTCEQFYFKITQEHWDRSIGMRPKNWNHHKKKRTHASYYMLFMQQSLVSTRPLLSLLKTLKS